MADIEAHPGMVKVLFQDGASSSSELFKEDTAVSEILEHLGCQGGALKRADGLKYIGSNVVPAGVYQLVRPAPPPAPQPDAITKTLAEIKSQQAEISSQQAEISSQQAEILHNTAITKRIVGQLCSQRVQSYMDPSSTNSSTIQQDTFRNKVTGYYGYPDAKDVPQLCMLTGCEHDWHDLVAGHIVPRSRAAEARADVNIKDINDPRNGIFWSRAVEGAWTAGIFCFASPAPDVFKFTLLDERYSHQRIQDWPLGKKPLKSITQHRLGDMTWGDLHATARLQFLPTQCGRPYRRALCFMARMALLNSSMQSWVRPDDVDSQADEFDYMSEDGKIEATIAWINDLRDDIKARD